MNQNHQLTLFAQASEPNGLALSTVLIATAVVVGLLLVAHAVYAVSTNRRAVAANRRHLLSLAIYLAFLVAIAVLAISSFGTLLINGHLLGYPLLLHLTAAGAFVFLLLGFAVVSVPQGRPAPDDEATSAVRWWLNRWSVWTLVLASLVTAGTMFASMLPVLDTAGLLQAATLHRYAGLLVVVAAVVHAYSLICVRLRWR